MALFSQLAPRRRKIHLHYKCGCFWKEHNSSVTSLSLGDINQRRTKQTITPRTMNYPRFVIDKSHTRNAIQINTSSRFPLYAYAANERALKFYLVNNSCLSFVLCPLITTCNLTWAEPQEPPQCLFVQSHGTLPQFLSLLYMWFCILLVCTSKDRAISRQVAFQFPFHPIHFILILSMDIALLKHLLVLNCQIHAPITIYRFTYVLNI